jgi:hypothetical protein
VNAGETIILLPISLGELIDKRSSKRMVVSSAPDEAVQSDAATGGG